MLANCCVWNYIYTSRSTRCVNNLGDKIFSFSYFSYVFVLIKYTSNMAACYNNDVVNDVTASHV